MEQDVVAALVLVSSAGFVFEFFGEPGRLIGRVVGGGCAVDGIGRDTGDDVHTLRVAPGEV